MRYAGFVGRLVALGITLLSVISIGIGWYGYSILKRIDFASFVMVSLFCGSCALVSVVYLMVKQPGEATFFIGDPQRYNQTQHIIMAFASLVFAFGSFWFALRQDDPRSPMGQILLVVGFFFFLFCAIVFLLQAWRRPP